jgi:hypothetical protein
MNTIQMPSQDIHTSINIGSGADQRNVSIENVNATSVISMGRTNMVNVTIPNTEPGQPDQASIQLWVDGDQLDTLRQIGVVLEHYKGLTGDPKLEKAMTLVLKKMKLTEVEKKTAARNEALRKWASNGRRDPETMKAVPAPQLPPHVNEEGTQLACKMLQRLVRWAREEQGLPGLPLSMSETCSRDEDGNQIGRIRRTIGAPLEELSTSEIDALIDGKA